MPWFGKSAKIAPTSPEEIPKKFILEAIEQLKKAGKSWTGEDGEEMVDSAEMMKVAKELHATSKKKGGRRRRSRNTKRRSRKTRRRHK